MASWWLPMAMLTMLARMKRGESLICDGNDRYYWEADKKRCSGTAKALQNRGLISPKGFSGEMSITPTGMNELRSNSARIPVDL